MTGLRRLRKIAEGLVIVPIAWELAATIVSLTVLLLATVQGGAPSPDRVTQIVGTLTL